MMVKCVLILSMVWTINSMAFAQENKPVNPYAAHFPQMKGCFLLYNLKTGAFEKEIGGENCRERMVACSTFKVPLSVMAFDAGILKDENQILKWDGKKDVRQEVNQDQDARTWIKYSVVWFSQRLTPQLGKEKIEKYLKDFHYGNQDFSAGIARAWLVPPSDPGGALKISPYEQVEFMKKLWTNSLPVSGRAMRITRDITYGETSPHGFKLSGKTGSSSYHHNPRLRLGWFISHVEGGGKEYIAVTEFSDLVPTIETSYGGTKAKEITKQILSEEGLW